MSSTAVDIVLAHYREHDALPTTRHTRAYTRLTALRKAHDAGELSSEDHERLSVLGDWPQRRAAPNAGTTGGLRVEAVHAHAEKVIGYTKLNGRLPSKGAAAESLTYLRARAAKLPEEFVERLDALPVAWNPGTRQRFLDRVEEIIAWRAANHGRWPRGLNAQYREGRYHRWFAYQPESTDPWRLATLDEKLPGWRSQFA